MAPKPNLLMSSGSKKEPRHTCLSEARASRSHKMWAEVSSPTPDFLHKGLSSSPSRWSCLLRVLWPVRRLIMALDWVLLKVINFALVPGLGPEINSWACLWVLPRPHHRVPCWLTNQWPSLMFTRLRPLSRIQKRTQFGELDLFLSSAKGLGGTYSVGPGSSTCA